MLLGWVILFQKSYWQRANATRIYCYTHHASSCSIFRLNRVNSFTREISHRSLCFKRLVCRLADLEYRFQLLHHLGVYSISLLFLIFSAN